MPNYLQSKSNVLYSTIARFYNIGLWLFGYNLAVRYFIGLIPFQKTARINILDAGCGTGLYTFALLKQFPNAMIVAFDLNTNMIEIMKNTLRRKNLNTQVKVFNGDITKPLPLQYEQFDLIITGGVLEYVDPNMAIKNLVTHLKSGGYFLNSPVKDDLFGRIVAKLYRFKPHSRSTNTHAFTNNGFIMKSMRSLPVLKEAYLFQKQK